MKRIFPEVSAFTSTESVSLKFAVCSPQPILTNVRLQFVVVSIIP